MRINYAPWSCDRSGVYGAGPAARGALTAARETEMLRDAERRDRAGILVCGYRIWRHTRFYIFFPFNDDPGSTVDHPLSLLLIQKKHRKAFFCTLHAEALLWSDASVSRFVAVPPRSPVVSDDEMYTTVMTSLKTRKSRRRLHVFVLPRVSALKAGVNLAFGSREMNVHPLTGARDPCAFTGPRALLRGSPQSVSCSGARFVLVSRDSCAERAARRHISSRSRGGRGAGGHMRMGDWGASEARRGGQGRP